jgi:hypothetical protein
VLTIDLGDAKYFVMPVTNDWTITDNYWDQQTGQDLPLDPTHLPTVRSQVVLRSQLDTVLPAGTLYATPAQRDAQLAARKAGFDKRFAPYPQGLPTRCR